jgi:threonine synthase
MDIQLASNFERFLFELTGRDAGKVRARMEELGKTGAFHLQPRELQDMRAAFACHAIGEHETETTIRTLYEETGELIDPHTAVGVAAAGKERGGDPMIVLSTAHAAKFPEAVKRATGRIPEAPERLKARLGQEERLTVLANDYDKVASFILDHARAAAPRSVESASRARSGVRA